jgi:hypothetical protein
MQCNNNNNNGASAGAGVLAWIHAGRAVGVVGACGRVGKVRWVRCGPRYCQLTNIKKTFTAMPRLHTQRDSTVTFLPAEPMHPLYGERERWTDANLGLQ